jgi:hypothetical protein
LYEGLVALEQLPPPPSPPPQQQQQQQQQQQAVPSSIIPRERHSSGVSKNGRQQRGRTHAASTPGRGNAAGQHRGLGLEVVERDLDLDDVVLTPSCCLCVWKLPEEGQVYWAVLCVVWFRISIFARFYFACIVRCIGLCHYYQGEHNNSEKPETGEN